MLVFAADKSHIGACVCVRDRQTGRGRWMCFSAEEDKQSRVQVESWFAFSLFDKVYAEHSVFEVVGGHSWRACSCVVKQ